MSLNAPSYPAAPTAPTPTAQFQHYAAAEVTAAAAAAVVVAVVVVVVVVVAAAAAAAAVVVAAAAVAAGFDAEVACFAGSVANAGSRRPWSGRDPRRISFRAAAAAARLLNRDAAGDSFLRTRRHCCFSICINNYLFIG